MKLNQDNDKNDNDGKKNFFGGKPTKSVFCDVFFRQVSTAHSDTEMGIIEQHQTPRRPSAPSAAPRPASLGTPPVGCLASASRYVQRWGNSEGPGGGGGAGEGACPAGEGTRHGDGGRRTAPVPRHGRLLAQPFLAFAICIKKQLYRHMTLMFHPLTWLLMFGRITLNDWDMEIYTGYDIRDMHNSIEALGQPEPVPELRYSVVWLLQRRIAHNGHRRESFFDPEDEYVTKSDREGPAGRGSAPLRHGIYSAGPAGRGSRRENRPWGGGGGSRGQRRAGPGRGHNRSRGGRPSAGRPAYAMRQKGFAGCFGAPSSWGEGPGPEPSVLPGA